VAEIGRFWPNPGQPNLPIPATNEPALRRPEKNQSEQKTRDPRVRALPRTAEFLFRRGPGELAGRIQFRGGGSAFVILDVAPGSSSSVEPPLQIFPEDTGVALPGDRVVVRVFPGRRGRRPGEKIGGVVRVLERERDTIVGNLVRGRREFVVQPDDPRFSYEILVVIRRKAVSPRPRRRVTKVVVKLGEWRRREDSLTGQLSRASAARTSRTPSYWDFREIQSRRRIPC